MSSVNSKLSHVSKSDSVTFKTVASFSETPSSTFFSSLFPTAGLDDDFTERIFNGYTSRLHKVLFSNDLVDSTIKSSPNTSSVSLISVSSSAGSSLDATLCLHYAQNFSPGTTKFPLNFTFLLFWLIVLKLKLYLCPSI